ncbi:hypothetical protein ACWD4B_15605 [Streptomyces sp. NPDC002536]
MTSATQNSDGSSAAARKRVDAARQTRPAELVAEAHKLYELADALLQQAVVAERALNTSWEAIGQELGVTKSTAHSRYSSAITTAARRREGRSPKEPKEVRALEVLEDSWDRVATLARKHTARRTIHALATDEITSTELVAHLRELANTPLTNTEASVTLTAADMQRIKEAAASVGDRRELEAQFWDKVSYGPSLDVKSSVQNEAARPLTGRLAATQAEPSPPSGVIARLEERIAHLEGEMAAVTQLLAGENDSRSPRGPYYVSPTKLKHYEDRETRRRAREIPVVRRRVENQPPELE